MIERIKNLFGVVMILAFALDIYAAQEVPTPQNVYAREAMSLNGEWHYFMDVQEMGYYDYFMNKVPWGYFNNAKPQNPWDMVEYDFDASPTMQIPTDWNTADPQLMFYEGTVWFRENLAMLDRIEGLAGTSPWCLKDFRSPRRPLPNVQDYFNRKGLYSDQGKRKRAFFVLRDWYREKAERYQVK